MFGVYRLGCYYNKNRKHEVPLGHVHMGHSGKGWEIDT